MNSKQRAYLRSLAQTMEPIFQIGKNSLTPEFTEAISEALEKRELIKISVLNNCEDEPKDLGQILSERTRSTLVQVMGRKITLYKESKDHKKIELPKIRKAK
ncbi:MAG: ribosome assembly RNA-binding protein YhbY [Vallitaleaceae bacterium]|nr:ribosome assembly RNA-binding protein YhbY [Vallitaleaceae bacterium]